MVILGEFCGCCFVVTFWSNRQPSPAPTIASARIPPIVEKMGVADCTSLQVRVVTSPQIDRNSPGVSRNVDAKST